MFEIHVSRHCDTCRRSFGYGWRCKQCELVCCDPCTKGGRSTTAGKLMRGALGIVTYGASEVVRAINRSNNQACPRCGGKDFMRI
jgi:hypothetical protein